MKLSSRKELLKESESTLKEIKKSLNEASDPQENDIKMVYDWMDNLINLVVADPTEAKKQRKYAMEFLNYPKIKKSSPVAAKKYAMNIDDAILSFGHLVGDMEEQLDELKKLKSKLPEIKKILNSIEHKIDQFNWENEM
jgi:predicted KAP-like P-loop ATPase